MLQVNHVYLDVRLGLRNILLIFLLFYARNKIKQRQSIVSFLLLFITTLK